jgi:hypothetical protein
MFFDFQNVTLITLLIEDMVYWYIRTCVWKALSSILAVLPTVQAQAQAPLGPCG